jgi:hypothetical protein
MKFKLNNNGELALVNRNRVLDEMNQSFPLSTAYIVDMPRIKESIKNMEFTKGKTMSIAIPLALGVATGGSGVFWDTFMTYIFPWLMDIAKVYCVIKIAQGFYEEKRGGRDGGTGFSTFVQYGRWYLLFMLIPWGVTLIDQLGSKMLIDLQNNPIAPAK